MTNPKFARHAPLWSVVATASALVAAACAPSLMYNMSTADEEAAPVTTSGIAALDNGETIDLGPIRAKENPFQSVKVIKNHGAVLIAGEGMRHIWVLWPTKGDKAKYEPIKALDGGPAGFKKPVFASVTNGACVTFKADGIGMKYVTGDGSVKDNECP